MKKVFSLVTASMIALIFYSCGTSSQQEGEETQTEEQTSTETQQPVELSEAPASPEYMDAILQLNSPLDGEELASGPVDFNFTVTNYELGVQTPDATEKPLANSGNGQHIHLILNNDPYSAHYEPEFQKEMEDGHYVALAFLSRSYHESVKNPEAFKLVQFTVGEAAEGEEVDLTAPHMFYSRPKGTYSGADTEQLLLDFYLVNTDLSEGGNSVRVTVNGDSEFTITEWKPYVLKNLPMGENTIKLELLDSEGNLVDSPFNPVERTVILEEGDVAS